MKKSLVMDNTILVGHLAFLITSFLVAIFLPFYIGALMILFHWLHEKKYSECILTIWQKNYGFAAEDDDYFSYLSKKLRIRPNKKFTVNLHYFIKTVILFIVLYKFFIFLFF